MQTIDIKRLANTVVVQGLQALKSQTALQALEVVRSMVEKKNQLVILPQVGFTILKAARTYSLSLSLP